LNSFTDLRKDGLVSGYHVPVAQKQSSFDAKFFPHLGGKYSLPRIELRPALCHRGQVCRDASPLPYFCVSLLQLRETDVFYLTTP